MKCKLITNNTLVAKENKTDTLRIEEIVFLDTEDIMEIFRCVRDYIHKGHKLLTHPLSGSVKPVETPFKSIAIDAEAKTMDVESLLIIEDAIIMAKNFTRERGYAQIPPEILEDFRTIDFGLIKSGLEGINNY